MTKVYLNAASHGLPARATLARMQAHVALELDVGPLEAAARAEAEVEAVHAQAAHFIGAARDDIALTSTTTATLAGLLPGVVKAGGAVLVAPQEWGDNLRFVERLGAQLRVLPRLEAGDTGADAWRDALTEEVAAIMVPLVSSITGARLPVEALGQMPRPEGCVLVVDAAQALGQVPVDVQGLGADILVGTCRKWLRGPRGTALAWRHPRLEARVPIDVLRPNDGNMALRLGLGAAFRAAGLSLGLRDRAWRAAQEIGLTTWSGAAPETGALTLAIPLDRVSALQSALVAADIVVRFPDPNRDEPHLAAGPAACVPMRVSPHGYNTEADIDALVRTLRAAL